MTSSHNNSTNEFDHLRGIIKNLIQDNEFVRTHEPAYFDSFEQSQHPRATAVSGFYLAHAESKILAWVKLVKTSWRIWRSVET